MPHKFTQEELRTHPNMADNLDFYTAGFIYSYKSYLEMSAEEKAAFPQFLYMNDYYAWLDIDDEILRADERIPILLAEFIRNTEYFAYLEGIKNDIYELFKSRDEQCRFSFQDQDTYAPNLALIKRLDLECGNIEMEIKALIIGAKDQIKLVEKDADILKL